MSRGKQKPADFDSATARRAASKHDEGDIRGAIRQLCASDRLLTSSLDSYKLLVAKQPPAPVDRRQPYPCEAEPFVVSTNQVLAAVRTFPPGSVGGPDGLRPQHLKDRTDRQVGGTLRSSLTPFVNFVLAGKMPIWARPAFFGASLFAFSKKDGGVRPIAVGVTLRRLAAKVACHSMADRRASVFGPRPLGVGVKRGAEDLAHAARRFLDNMPSTNVFVKLDFANAFNTVCRDVVREAVVKSAPCLLGYVDSAYGAPSHLSFGDFTNSSAEGVQQRDPLGPMFFSLATNPILLDIQSEFISEYLDDIGIGGPVGSAISDIRRLEDKAKSCVLLLNHGKCEVIGLNPTNRQEWSAAGLKFTECPPEDAILLGTTIQAGKGVDKALEEKRHDLSSMIGRLALLPARTELFLLRNIFVIPKLLYILRTGTCCDSAELLAYDEMIRTSLASILNIDLSTSAWAQACLQP